MDELHRLAAAGLPEWIATAVAVLGVLWRVARNARQSARLQGERIGELERRADSERTRRQQVEAVLLDDGLRLPYWPPDGPRQQRASRRAQLEAEPSRDDDDDERDDGRHSYPATAYASTPPPPPPLQRSNP